MNYMITLFYNSFTASKRFKHDDSETFTVLEFLTYPKTSLLKSRFFELN